MKKHNENRREHDTNIRITGRRLETISRETVGPLLASLRCIMEPVSETHEEIAVLPHLPKCMIVGWLSICLLSLSLPLTIADEISFQRDFFPLAFVLGFDRTETLCALFLQFLLLQAEYIVVCDLRGLCSDSTVLCVVVCLDGCL